MKFLRLIFIEVSLISVNDQTALTNVSKKLCIMLLALLLYFYVTNCIIAR